jgi:hypothetical protein
MEMWRQVLIRSGGDSKTGLRSLQWCERPGYYGMACWRYSWDCILDTIDLHIVLGMDLVQFPGFSSPAWVLTARATWCVLLS